MKTWMIYGANGYTGELTSRLAKEKGYEPILAGRSPSKVTPLAEELGFDTRCFDLTNAIEREKGLEGINVVLNCAGPFSKTAEHMLAACKVTGTHYLDITGEIGVFEYVHQRDAEWKDAGIVAMPGVGFDVVPSDCLAAMLKREMPEAIDLRLAFASKKGALSPGTTKTAIEGLPEGGKVRRDGNIVSVPPAAEVVEIEYTPDWKQLSVMIPWGDVSTAYYSTGIPNIEVFLGSPEKQIKMMKLAGKFRPLLGLGFVQNFMKGQVDKKVSGPSQAQREADETRLYGRVKDPKGNVLEMQMRTPEGYTLTAITSLMAVQKLLEMSPEPGAYTPSMLFGVDFIMEVDGVSVIKVIP